MAGRLQFLLSLPFDANPCRFSSVVLMSSFVKPRVPQRIFRSDSLRGIVNKDLLEKIQKLGEECVGRRYDFLS
jgi:hypothetical protein